MGGLRPKHCLSEDCLLDGDKAELYFYVILDIITPTTEVEWNKVTQVFREKCNFPNCCGAIDGNI